MTWQHLPKNQDDLESYLSSLEREADCSARSYLDGERCATLSATTTASTCSSNASTTDGSTTPPSGTMCELSTGNRGGGEWISCPPDSRASRTVSQANNEAPPTRVTSGTEPLTLLATYDPRSSSWRTSQQSFIKAPSDASSVDWPYEGIMLSGRVYPQERSVPRTAEIDGGALRGIPTPTSSDSKGSRNLTCDRADDKVAGEDYNTGTTLTDFAKLYPTPTAADGDRTSDEYARGNPTLVGAAKQWPTPVADGDRTTDYQQGGRSLGAEVRRWPTPASRDHKDSGQIDKIAQLPEREGRGVDTLRQAAAVQEQQKGDPLPSGGLNPMWVAWLMGWPIGWTASKPLATGKSLTRWLLHGRSLVAACADFWTRSNNDT